MLFMALVGGLGTFEGPIIGACFLYYGRRFGATGVWYMVGLGAAATLFSLFLPRGLWGTLEDRYGIALMPIGYRVETDPGSSLAGQHLIEAEGRSQRRQTGVGPWRKRIENFFSPLAKRLAGVNRQADEQYWTNRLR